MGPSAHSYNGISRSWNVSHIESYIKAIENGLSFSEEEILSDTDKYNEYILTRIRTIWGVSLTEIKNSFGDKKAHYFLNIIDKYINNGMVNQNNDIYKINRKGYVCFR